ncbi:MAG: LysR family transcriptional regulator [Planctomycetaceae bacterium]|nr:LysR family transcriptional regulator [Planctomycetaceae bacterium]
MAADWVNYHHLLYFWMVAREGSISAACEKLHLAQPTISGQLKKLENQLGGQLFDRVGRELVLTDLGRTVLRYANEIFTVSEELRGALRGEASGRPARFHVGIPEVLPKLIAFRLLRPLMELDPAIQLVCHEGAQSHLLGMLATHELDVVLSDAPISASASVRAFNHPLGQCEVGLFGTAEQVAPFRLGLPESLKDAPILLPALGTTLRNSMEKWLLQSEIPVRVVGEFDDTALMKVFAEAGFGLIPAPMAIEQEIREQFSLELLCRIPQANEHFYAITVEKKLRHPCVVAISEAAAELFSGGDRAAL